MKKRTIFISLLIFSLNVTALAKGDSAKALNDLSKRFFPAIGETVAECAVQWPDYFRDDDRDIIVDAYFTQVSSLLTSDDRAPTLKKQFGAMARYWRSEPSALLKVFGCARYITSDVEGQENLFVEANRLFLAFDDDLKTALITNIEAFREDFAGKGAKDKETKIANITLHIANLETLATCSSQEFEADLRAQNNSIYNFILNQHGERREMALAFSIAAAKSSLEIVKYFDPPTKKELAGIVASEIGHTIAGAFGGLFGRPKK